MPPWFGIPEANDAYVGFVDTHDTWVAYSTQHEPIGLISGKLHFPETAEIEVLAVRLECVDLRERTDLSLDDLARIATNLGWNATVVNERLIILESDDEMSGSISIDGERRVGVVVDED